MSTPGEPHLSQDERVRWREVDRLLHEALARPEADRQAFLEQACPQAALRREVQELLAAHDTRGPLDRLNDGVMGALLAVDRLPTPPEAALSAHERYRIVERIGGGGMGVVYRARDLRLDRDVAMKFLPPHLSADEAAKTRFLVEARAAAALEHPNICTVHEIGDTADGQLYIVMACYDGDTVDRLISRGPLPVDDAVRIATEVARGLAKAHERGIVHRDIKPANVMVTGDGLVKILDFGIAKLSGVSVTQTVGAIGTLAYMSPEQAFGEVVDHRTDVWSLGVVLFEMLAGVRPFRGTGEQSLLAATLSAEPEPLSRYRPDVPAAMEVVIRRALAKDPNGRYQHTLEFAQALADAHATRMPTGGREKPAPAGTADEAEHLLARAGERRPLTMVVSQVVGYDVLLERLAPERADAIIARIAEAAHDVAAQHDGMVNHAGGHEVTLLFGVPTAHEDDAVRGTRAALALHARVADVASSLESRLAAAVRLRTGIHTGLMVAQRQSDGERRYRIGGSASDVARRMAAEANPDEVLVSAELKRLITSAAVLEEAAAVTLPGHHEPVATSRVLGVSDGWARGGALGRGRLTPFVGRDKERASLTEHWMSARDGNGRVTVLLGEAGAGKSRLLQELHDILQQDGTRIFTGRCDPYGGSTPFLPFVDAAHDALGLSRAGKHDRHDAVVRAVAAFGSELRQFLPLYLALFAIPSDVYALPDDLQGQRFQAAMLSAIAALFTAGTNHGPAVLLLEDWHWADDASREALRQVVEITAAIPLLVVVTSRPDPSITWGIAEHQALLHLAPLDSSATAGIVCTMFEATGVDPLLLQRLHERTGGNPFFLEEVCAALREDGRVQAVEGIATYVGGADVLHVPDTVQGVLRTRIDRLDADARDVLRVASVVGRTFTRGVLDDVVSPRVNVTTALDRLKMSGLVQQVRVVPEPTYRFKHALTEEVAYESLLEHQRTVLHESVGRAIERRYEDQLDEQVERLAHHFGRAEVWPVAIRYALQAADRATLLCQHGEAMATMERVEEWIAHLPADGSTRDIRAEVLLRQERIAESLGLRHRQLAVVAELVALLEPLGPSDRLAGAYLRQADAFTLRQRYGDAEAMLQRALKMAATLGDGVSRRKALSSIALLRSHERRYEDALPILEEAIRLAREAGDWRAEAGDRSTMANCLRALGQPQRALELIRETLSAGNVESGTLRHGTLLNVMATIYRDLGDYDRALETYRLTESSLNNTTYASFSLPGMAYLQLQQGKVEEALASYRLAVELNRKARYADGLAHACRSLGEALVGLQRDEEAISYLKEAATLFHQLEDAETERLMRKRLAAAFAGCAARALASSDPLSAGAFYEQGISAAVAAGDVARELELRNAYGIWCWERKAFAQAMSQFEAGLRLCVQEGDRVHEGLMRNSIGACLLKLGRSQEAITILTESLQVNGDTGERQLLVHTLLTLTRAQLAQEQTAEAAATCARAVELAESLPDAALTGAARLLQAELHQMAADTARRASIPIL